MSKIINDVDSILEEFQTLEDRRVNINRRHLLGDLIVISIMAVIAGADGPWAIGTWAKTTNLGSEKDLKFRTGFRRLFLRIWSTGKSGPA